MKKETCPGALTAPARRISLSGQIRKSLNRVLPEDCQVRTASDLWYVGAVGAFCVTFVFPPALMAAVYCVHRAGKSRKKEGGRDEQV